VAGWARRHWLFGIALAGAVAIRVLVVVAFGPVMWFGGDSASYLSTGLRLIPDPSRVGGYGFCLWLLRPLHSFVAVAAVQHAMGVAMGVLIYRLARRYGLPGWAATLAALPVFFDAYQLQLEQDMLPDIPFVFLIVLALYLLLRAPGGGRLAATAIAALALGLSAILWPVGLALLLVLLVYLVYLAVRGGRTRWAVAGAALLCGVMPVLGYAGWFDVHEGQFSLTRSDGAYLWSRTMSFADCAVIKPPAAEQSLCPPEGPRMAASLYLWNDDSPLLAMPGGRFSARTNSLALNFALRAIETQPGGYLTAAAHDFWLSFYWDRPVHPDADTVDRYQFADAATAWVPATMGTRDGGTVASDQARYAGSPSPTRLSQPLARWLVSYQNWIYLRGTLLGLILLGGLAAMIVRRRAAGAALAWAFALTLLLVPPLTADFDLRYLIPAVPVACLAAALACAPRHGRPGTPDKRMCTTSPAATATTARPTRTAPAGDVSTTSLPSESTSTASPDSS